MKKTISALMALTIVVSASPIIHASEKFNIDIYKEISESKVFTFGDFFGVKYSLKDKKVKDEIAKKLIHIRIPMKQVMIG